MSIANTNSRWINGNLVFYANGNRQRWLDAIGENVVKYIDDFEICPYTTLQANSVMIKDWVITHTSAGTGHSGVIPDDKKGGVMKLYAAANENDGIQMQSENEPFRVEANSPLYFGVRWRIEEETDSDMRIGLMETDVSVTTNTSHGIAFGTADGATTVLLHVIKDETTDKTLSMLSTIVADTWYIDEFLVSSTGSVKAWHDGTLIGDLTTSAVPSTDLAVTFAYLNGAGTMSGKGLELDWVRCIQLLNARAT